MKLTKYTAALCVSFLALAACETDIDQVVFNSTTATPATLSVEGAQQDLYTLDANNASANVFTLNWTAPDMGLQVAVTNVLQMDIDGHDFANATTLVTETERTNTSYTAVTSELNANIQTLLATYGLETPTAPEDALTMNFRLISFISSSASDTLYSDVLNLRVLPYEGEAVYPSLDVVGINNNWDFASSQKIYSPTDDGVYSAMVYFGGNTEWKLAASSWDADKNWGGAPEAEASSAVLTPNGSNIPATTYAHTTYMVTFDRATATLEMSQGRDFWGIIGINGKWGDNDDIEMTYEAANESNEGHNLTATVEVTGGDTFKIRPDHAWDGEINADNIAFEGDVAKNDGDNNLKLTAGNGTYTIKWYFNKVTPHMTVTKND